MPRQTKEARAAYMREYRRRHAGHLNATRRARMAGEGYRRWNLHRHFRLTPEEYVAMFTAQGGVCRICRRPESDRTSTGKVKHLAVDHCHTTGKIRGLLCGKCNKAIGLLGDSVELLQNAIRYLQSQP